MYLIHKMAHIWKDMEMSDTADDIHDECNANALLTAYAHIQL